MKLQHIAAAVALAAAGTANAAIDNFATGNGSFFLVAYDTLNGTKTASLFDLGFNLTDFVGTGNGTLGATGTLAQTGTKVVWDLANNTVSVNGSIASTGLNSWSTALNKLVANSTAGEIRWLVGAGDSVGSGANARYILAGQAATSNTNATNAGPLNQSNTLFSGSITSKGTLNQAGIDNGAWTFAEATDGSATAANGYIFDTTIFSPTWFTRNTLTNNQVLDGAKQNMWIVDGAGNEQAIGKLLPGQTADNGANLLNNVGTLVFNSQAGTLTWETPAVPEPSTYAMALVGLALAGVAARRRRA